LVSPLTRFVARESNATIRAVSLTDGNRLTVPLAFCPAVFTLTNSVV
jgi:hypothetical protein